MQVKVASAMEKVFDPAKLEPYTSFRNTTIASESFSGRIRKASQDKRQRVPVAAPSLRVLFDQYVADLFSLSMYFDLDFRLALTRKTKSLLSSENWDLDDPLPAPGAFLTLLRCFLALDATTVPSLGTDGRRAISASWVSPLGRLTLTAREKDSVDYVLSRRMEDGTTERAAGFSSVSRIKAALNPYDPDVWLKS
jgi:hypothetical protein